MDSLPANAIKSIFYFSSHPVADLIRPNIKKYNNYIIISSGNYKRLTRFTTFEKENKEVSENLEFEVIRNHIKNKLNVEYLLFDKDVNKLDELYIKQNRKIISKIMRIDKYNANLKPYTAYGSI